MDYLSACLMPLVRGQDLLALPDPRKGLVDALAEAGQAYHDLGQQLEQGFTLPILTQLAEWWLEYIQLNECFRAIEWCEGESFSQRCAPECQEYREISQEEYGNVFPGYHMLAYRTKGLYGIPCAVGVYERERKGQLALEVVITYWIEKNQGYCEVLHHVPFFISDFNRNYFFPYARRYLHRGFNGKEQGITFLVYQGYDALT